MIQIIKEFEKVGLVIQFLGDSISIQDTMGKMIITILSVVTMADRHRILKWANEDRIMAQANGSNNWSLNPVQILA